MKLTLFLELGVPERGDTRLLVNPEQIALVQSQVDPLGKENCVIQMIDGTRCLVSEGYDEITRQLSLIAGIRAGIRRYKDEA